MQKYLLGLNRSIPLGCSSGFTRTTKVDTSRTSVRRVPVTILLRYPECTANLLIRHEVSRAIDEIDRKYPSSRQVSSWILPPTGVAITSQYRRLVGWGLIVDRAALHAPRSRAINGPSGTRCHRPTESRR
jgi:hypothetical protein